jgi:hypothetical protein
LVTAMWHTVAAAVQALLRLQTTTA